MSGISILVVEDEIAIQHLIVSTLQMAGFTAVAASSVSKAYELLVDHHPALILLDWMLPNGQSGVDFCRRIKNDDTFGDIPIIMLTARSDEDQRVQGLDAGADDYITKPFSTRELVSRIKAVLRRSSHVLGDKILAEKDLSLDPKSHRVSVAKTPVNIGPTEYRLLHFFMSHPNQAFSRDQIINHVWGSNVYIEDRTIDVHIRRLRKILAPFNYQDFVQTVRGTGYRFSSENIW